MIKSILPGSLAEEQEDIITRIVQKGNEENNIERLLHFARTHAMPAIERSLKTRDLYTARVAARDLARIGEQIQSQLDGVN